jgi:hypothetical protein
MWAPAYRRTFLQDSLSLATDHHFATPSFFISSSTPSNHLRFGLPFLLLPSGLQSTMELYVYSPSISSWRCRNSFTFYFRQSDMWVSIFWVNCSPVSPRKNLKSPTANQFPYSRRLHPYLHAEKLGGFYSQTWNCTNLLTGRRELK